MQILQTVKHKNCAMTSQPRNSWGYTEVFKGTLFVGRVLMFSAPSNFDSEITVMAAKIPMTSRY